MGFEAMAALTHRMEEVLAAMRDGGAPVTPAIIDALFACLDTLQEMVTASLRRRGRGRRRPVLARLDAIAAAAPPSAPPPRSPRDAPPVRRPPRQPPQRPPRARPATPVSAYDRMLVAEARERGPRRPARRRRAGRPAACWPRARAVMVARELEALGDAIASRPPAEAIERRRDRGRARLLDRVGVTDADAGPRRRPGRERGRAPRSAPGARAGRPPPPSAEAIGRLAEPPLANWPPAPAEAPRRARGGAAGPAAEARTARATATVRVGTDRLDALMNLMGEMVIQRTRLAQLSSEHALGDLRGAVEDMTRVTDRPAVR